MKSKSQSGTSSPPTILPYPKVAELSKEHPINGVFSYIQEKPQMNGIALLIQAQPRTKEVAFRAGTWDGKLAPQSEIQKIAEFIGIFGAKLAQIMALVKVEQAMFYISADEKLVDVRTSINKWLGPGMVENIFSKVISTPKTIEITSITSELYDAIMADTGKYSGNLLIKPSRPRYEENLVYATVTRCQNS